MKLKNTVYRPKNSSKSSNKRTGWVRIEDSKTHTITKCDLKSRKRTPKRHSSSHSVEFRSVTLP